MKKSADESPATVLDGDWLTLAETVKVLGKSQSTVERLVGSGALKSKLEPREGRKPERLYSARDAQRLAEGDEGNSRSLSLVRTAAATQLAIPAEAVSSLREVMTEWRNQPAPIGLREKFWLSLDEAAEISGLPRSVVARLAADGKVAAMKCGAWRIHRASLEAFAG